MAAQDIVSKHVFDIVKSFSHSVKIFTDQGKYTVDPLDAAHIYITDLGSMIIIEPESVRMYLGRQADYNDTKEMINKIKNTVKKFGNKWQIKQYGRHLVPKDFAFRIKQDTYTMNDLNEAFQKPFGSTKTSYITCESARLIIKHKTEVNEELRGSRSRNIHQIFIESNGERNKLPFNNLTAAKAMLRHVSEGGYVYDDFGNYITETIKNINNLNRFVKYSVTNNLVNENSQDIIEACASKKHKMRENLKKIVTKKGYFESKENFSPTLSETQDTSELEEMFTVKTIDETVADTLPLVAQIAQEISESNKRQNLYTNFLTQLEENSIIVKKIKNNDPDNPNNFTFESNDLQAQQLINYFAKHVVAEDQRNMLESIALNYPLYDSEQKNSIIQNILGKITVNEQDKSKDLSESMINKIKKNVNLMVDESVFFTA
jgi:hypothetical protein